MVKYLQFCKCIEKFYKIENGCFKQLFLNYDYSSLTCLNMFCHVYGICLISVDYGSLTL